MTGWVIFGWSLLWLIGMCLTLTWILRDTTEESANEYLVHGIIACLLFWPIVLTAQAAIVLSGKKFKPEEKPKPQERLCGCAEGYEEWVGENLKRRRCCYQVTKERLKAREERR